MHHTLDIVTATRRPMRLLYIPAGEAGPNAARVPVGHPYPIVEIYDRSHLRDAHEMFTGGYFSVWDLLDRPDGMPFRPALFKDYWDIDGAAMNIAAAWLRHLVSRLPDAAAATR